MLYPSVDKLKTKIDSKYSLVSLASKRARAMQEGSSERLSSYESHKNVGKALEEVAAGVLTQVKQDEKAIYEDEV
ncbi:MAG: DNA-directed RNA polymerase subunit omega [Kurthia sp.]|uniref:DNA-directed RNA polymerase subunit omega n=1 Tax=Kurthia zopfii TaxID=1650 RepID=A0A2U3AE74_9BACL|nr:DNA-directed RNA polymerase subunit omega [Kurthia zopfii]PWI22862.1 DNA-directed RNA polymerase subunit omega [Kurthia zopfii]TDR40174.1 DNA-directed RNA polymerase subunit omega [Kurthia zopfii]STX09026.1 DNA-directed RNA polymerase subunit omega [Kurthia zopfii]VEI04760.1 DNA-directed RNA polymerase subunit omega [Kurthia zopfii]GEK30241.1 DNA-directed RNA polymerase subunit omega [Kurthia zopfii]